MIEQAALQPQERVNITDDLKTRHRRNVNFLNQNAEFYKLVDLLHKDPAGFLQAVTDMACHVCEADSAGISLLEKDNNEEQFHCIAISGTYSHYQGRKVPADKSPFQKCLLEGAPQLLEKPGRFYHSFHGKEPMVLEKLVVPLPQVSEAITSGVFWIATHTPLRLFDEEDVKFITTLATFVATSQHLKLIAEKEKTQRIEAENQTHFIRSIIDSSPDCVKVIDYKGRLLSMNENGCRQMEVDDFSFCEMQPWVDFWKEEDRIQAEKALERARNGETAEFEGYCETAKGTPKWWHVIVTPIKNIDEKEQKILSISRDVTERREAARQLNEAREAAESANIAKTEFLANMSHEIRTPMNAIIGITDILAQSEPLTQKQKEFLKTLQMSADSLLALVNDLLDIAKIEAHSIELEKTPFSLAQIIQEVISMMAVKVREKGLEFTVEGPCIENRIYVGDPIRIRQIILNLCSNAVKFTEEGHVRVAITCDPTGNTTETIRIAVEDTGIGISPEKLPNIFDKFTQADTSISRRYGGTGLGLAITKTLVEVMGGQINVNSVLGEGSTFTIHLPLESSLDAEVDNVPPFKGFKNIKSSKNAKDLILLVEDYLPNIVVAKEFLEKFGFRVITAEHGAEAVETVQKNSNIRAVLMDIQMHGMNGFEATKEIRQWEVDTGKERLPIIGMTAHALQGDRERCLAADMDEYISKPYNSKELEEKINTLLKDQCHA